MATPQSAAEHYRAQQALTMATIAAARRAWQQMTSDFDTSWARVLPRLMLVLSAGQLAAARRGADYVPDVLDEQDIDAPAEAAFVPESLVGVASDGRPLDSLLYTSVIRAKQAAGTGLSPDRALRKGRDWLDMATQTQLADADRAAVETVMASRRKLGGYVRMVNLPACGRCIILAGAFYRWNEGFERHPGCDCRHILAQEDTADEVRTEPKKAFNAMTREEQDKAFTEAGAEAIRLGADPIQVINARRGMQTTVLHGRQALVTTEGITRRGEFGRQEAERGGAFNAVRVGRRGYIRNQVERRARRVRLMPETILEQAESRDDAIRLLKLYRYLA